MRSKIHWVVTVIVTGIAALTAATLVAGQTVPATPAYRPVGTAQELELVFGGAVQVDRLEVTT